MAFGSSCSHFLVVLGCNSLESHGHDRAASGATGLACEDSGVVVAESQRANCHDLHAAAELHKVCIMQPPPPAKNHLQAMPAMLTQAAYRGNTCERQQESSHLGDGTKSEHVRILQLCHVLQAVGCVPQSIHDQLVQAADCLPRILWSLEVLQLLRVFAPDLLWPEHPAQSTAPQEASLCTIL